MGAGRRLAMAIRRSEAQCRFLSAFSKHSGASMTGSDMVICHINLDDESFLERPMLTPFADLCASDLPGPALNADG
jgi:hypothetical protein